MSRMKRLARDQRGATAVEYALIMALIFLGMIGAVQAFATGTITMWTGVSDDIEAAREGGEVKGAEGDGKAAGEE